MTLDEFCDRLAATPLSQTFQDLSWFVPSVQTVHILSIAVVMTSIGAIAAKLLGWRRGRQSLGATVADFMPWIWMALVVLLLTGTLLTITEPSRELLNLAFRLKMLMIVALAGLLGFLQHRLRCDPQYWSASPPRRAAGRALGALSLTLAVTIVVAGRWIAYI